MNQIIAIDFGIKRCGLAHANLELGIALPLKNIITGKLLDFLKQYNAENNIKTIVLGLPKFLDGTYMGLKDHIQKLKLQLIKEFPNVDIKHFDERYTSKIASQSLRLGGHKLNKSKKGIIDEVSAVLILQDFLNYNSTLLKFSRGNK